MAKAPEKIYKLLFLLMLITGFAPRSGYAAGGVGVAAFVVNAPASAGVDYLSTAPQDAVIGSLQKRGIATKSVELLDPNKLQASQVKHAGVDLLVAGRINVV